jgi:hypothetical protein
VAQAPAAGINMSQVETMINKAVGHALEQLSGQVTHRMQESLAEILHHRLPFLPSSEAPTLSTSMAIAVHPSRVNVLRALYPQRSSHQFLSPQQAELLEAVLQGQFHVFGILATGGGKSVAIYGPPKIESSGLSVCIVPFISLEEEQLRNADGFNIPVSAWPNRKMEPHITRLVIIPAHRAGTSECLQWLEAIAECKHLKRILFDEAHHLLTDPTYRHCYDRFDRFVKLGVPIHFLSATLFPWSVAAIAAKMRIPMSLTREIRGPTYRPNLWYSVRKLETKQQLYDHVHDLYNLYSKKLGDDDRMLIFCSTYRDADALAELTQLPIYRGHMEKDITAADNTTRKQEVARLWRSGQPKTLIATSAFGEGIDHKHVRCVISCEPRNLISSSQELGRGGRDGKRSEAITLYTAIPTVSSVDGVDHAGVLALINFLELHRCHRWSLGVLDNSVHTCTAIPNAILCGVCVAEAVSPPLLILFYILTSGNQCKAPLAVQHIPLVQPVMHQALIQTETLRCERLPPMSSPTPMPLHVSKRPRLELPTEENPFHLASSSDSNPPDHAAPCQRPAPAQPQRLSLPQHQQQRPAVQTGTRPTIATVAARHAMEYASRNSKLTLLKEMLDTFLKRCPLCEILRLNNCGNSVWFCSTGLINPQTKPVMGGDNRLGDEFMNTFRDRLSIPRGQVCYRCFVPMNEALFSHKFVKTVPCTYEDLIKSIAWTIWQSPALLPPEFTLRADIFEVLGIQQLATLEDFKHWCQTLQPGPDRLLNVLELVICWYSMYKSGRW